MNDEPMHPFPARLPKSLHRKLEKRAKQNVRSLNSELIVAVRHYLTGEMPPQVAAEAATPQPAPQTQEPA